MKVELEIPAYRIVDVLLSSEPASYTIIHLGMDVQKEIERKLGWDLDVESNLRAEMPGGMLDSSKYLYELVLDWVNKRLEELDALSGL